LSLRSNLPEGALVVICGVVVVVTLKLFMRTWILMITTTLLQFMHQNM